MIATAVVSMIGFIMTAIASIVAILIPTIDIGTNFTEALLIILSTTSQANNFMHFILGDAVYMITLATITLVTYKYIVYPIISWTLSFTQMGRN